MMERREPDSLVYSAKRTYVRDGTGRDRVERTIERHPDVQGDKH